MYSPFRLATKFLSYYFKAFNGRGHGMHSPFVFRFITQVMIDTTSYPDYKAVEQLRAGLKRNHTYLDIEDFGAGSGKDKTNRRKVSDIAKHAAKPPKYAQLLYRMVRYYQPGKILELGTSLGVTTAYLSLGNNKAEVVTMEGAGAIAEKAIANFKSLGLSNISTVVGNFDETLPETLKELARPDFVFVDGNHRREPTQRYFDALLPFVHNDTIVVFDDIHWSGEMEQAWRSIQQHEAVRCTIDLFFIGIVLFRKEFKEKQDFIIRF